jgi:hypothetical protein
MKWRVRWGARDLAERQDGALVLRRGFSLAPDDRVVVIEDVVTTGGSTRETMDVATAAGATVVAAGAIIDRSGGNATLGVPFKSLVTLTVPTYQPDACPPARPVCPSASPARALSERGNAESPSSRWPTTARRTPVGSDRPTGFRFNRSSRKRSPLFPDSGHELPVVEGASRTDAGVHALGQVASVRWISR